MRPKVFVLCIIFFIFFLVFLIQIPSIGTENYGGPIKNIKQIPHHNCEEICDTYYNDCMNKYGYMSVDNCYNRFKLHCPLECDMSAYNRL